MTSIRPIVEQYTTLGLVVIPTAGKRPCSAVLDEHGQPLRRPDGSLVRWQPFIERPPSDAELDAAEWQRATGLALVLGPASWRAWPYLWCLDVEAEFRDEGEQWLDQHVPGWRDGVTVETGSGGLHVYFLASHPVTTAVVRWGGSTWPGSAMRAPTQQAPRDWPHLPLAQRAVDEPTATRAVGRARVW